MKKVVVHVVNSTSFSGLESVACDIIEGTKEKYQGIYVTKSGAIIDVLKKKHIDYYIINKMSVKEIRKMCKKLQPDIIHAHDYHASCICSLANIKIPIISHLHNNSPWIKKIHPFSVLYLYCAKRFKKILTVSKSIEKEYIFSKYIKDKIECIGNPVSRDKIINQVNDYKKKYDLCCVARLSEPKDPFMFCNIIKKIKEEVPNIKCIWVGEGNLKEKAIEYRNKLGLNENIDFLGFQENPYQYMAISKVFILPTKWEGYGLVAFEALTLGIPCVASNVGGLPNIVDDSCGYLCNNETEFINEISKLLKNNNYYQEKKKKAINKSKNLDNSKTYVSNIEKIYKEEGDK